MRPPEIARNGHYTLQPEPVEQPSSLREQSPIEHSSSFYPEVQRRFQPAELLVIFARLPRPERELLAALAGGKNPKTLYKDVGIDKEAVDPTLDALCHRLGVKGTDGLIDVQAAYAKIPYDIRENADKMLPQTERSRSGRNIDSLTEREQEILRLLAKGRTSKEIGKDLGVSKKTIEHHRAKMINKLGAANTAELIALALNEDIL